MKELIEMFKAFIFFDKLFFAFIGQLAELAKTEGEKRKSIADRLDSTDDALLGIVSDR